MYGNELKGNGMRVETELCDLNVYFSEHIRPHLYIFEPALNQIFHVLLKYQLSSFSKWSSTVVLILWYDGKFWQVLKTTM